MADLNLSEAFGLYKTKPQGRGRSAVTNDGSLVVSCWYAGFRRSQPGVLRYEEDLSEATGPAAENLRLHLADALAKELSVRLVVAMEQPQYKRVEGQDEERPSRTAFHARKDLLGRVTSFDGQKVVIDFRKTDE